MGTRFSPLSLHSMVSEPHQPISTFHLSLRADEYIYPSIFRDEIFPTQEIVLMWNIPHKEDNSGIRFYSYLEMPDRRSGRGPIQKRIQSIVALYPHFKSFLCRSQRGYNHMCLGVCLHTHTHTHTPRCISSAWMYLNCSLRTEEIGIAFLILSAPHS